MSLVPIPVNKASGSAVSLFMNFTTGYGSMDKVTKIIVHLFLTRTVQFSRELSFGGRRSLKRKFRELFPKYCDVVCVPHSQFL